MAQKIVCIQKLAPQYVEAIRSAAPSWELIHGADRSIWFPHVKEAEIIVGWNRQLESECLDQETPLRWVQHWGAGVDTLPLQKFRERGVILTNASGVHPYPISETIFAMMLAFTRKLPVYVRQQQQKMWHHAHLGNEMHGKTIGILGVGAIGGETARLAKAFSMRTLGMRRTKAPHESVDRMYAPDALHELLAQCDYVVNTLPLTEETKHLIDRAALSAMKPEAFYVNIGRGATTDTAALVDALTTGRIAGAGLDVFETEPLPPDSPLWNLENVIITPHSSGSTTRYDQRVAEIFLENLHSYLQDGTLAKNLVDVNLQY